MEHRNTLKRAPFIAALLGAAGVPGVARAADCTVDVTSVTTGDFSTSATPSGWVIGGDAFLTAPSVDAEGAGWLRLTSASTGEVGYAFADTEIPSCSGVVFSFEYTAWGGTGADGFSVFLFDGSYDASTFEIGLDGGYLGYVGMDSGYLGVGIDEYGNFTNYTGIGAFYPNAITVAGSASTYWTALATTGAYALSDWDSPRSRPDTDTSYYRQLYVVLQPGAVSGYTVTVYQRAGDETVPTKIITTSTLEVAPEDLKIGFAASTGGLTNNHEVGEVGFQPVADRDLAEVRVDLSADADTYDAGTTITYTFEVSNAWAETVTDVDVSMDLSADLEDITWTCSSSGDAECPASSGSGAPSGTVDLPSGGALTFTVTGTIGYLADSPLSATGTASVTDAYVDLSPLNNTDTVSVTVNAVDGGADGDPVPDEVDLDDDNDGIMDFAEPIYGDTDGDGVTNEHDLDSDGDGVWDAYEAGYGAYDTDDDGVIDGDATALGIPEAVADGEGTLDCGGASSLLENAGFEEPDVGTFGMVNKESVPGWNTTDSTGFIEIWGDGFSGVPSLEGGQFAELNAYESAELYQETVTEAGVDYVIVTGHRGRAGVDVAEFLVDGVSTDTYTDGTDGWGVYLSTFTGTGDTTRLGFAAVSTATGDASVGNFFDVIGVFEKCTYPDFDGDGTPDHLDADDDGDGIPTIDEDVDGDGDPRNDDTDGDGAPNYLDVDADGDGLTDADESALGTDPVQADTDGDGLSDGAELDDYGTDPLLVDTDGDGLSDGDEVGEHGTDPTSADTDGDGLDDGEEVNAYETDPTSADTDGDGLEDGDEVLVSGTDPRIADTDGDGLSDGDEVSTYSTDPLDTDTDDDGLTDGDEVSTYSTDPNDLDTDDDGLSDGDEVSTHSTDPNDADTDDDGLTDGDEVSSTSTDPNDADSDDDGLSDGDEVSTHGTDPNEPDTDDGGMPDGQEVSDGTDPLDPSDDAVDEGTTYYKGGCGCSSAPAPSAPSLAALGLGLATLLARRRRR